MDHMWQIKFVYYDIMFGATIVAEEPVSMLYFFLYSKLDDICLPVQLGDFKDMTQINRLSHGLSYADREIIFAATDEY